MTGCLAAIAIPNFVKFQCRAKQSEAKSQLKSLLVAEESFNAENDRYGSLEELEFQPRGQVLRYDYSVQLSADKKSFVATATGKDDMSGDVWTIDKDVVLEAQQDRCNP